MREYKIAIHSNVPVSESETIAVITIQAETMTEAKAKAAKMFSALELPFTVYRERGEHRFYGDK